jgi:TolB-like protein
MSVPSAAPDDDRDGRESASPVRLPEGTRLRDQYRIDDVLGAGSFGITYRAHDERLDTTVAIKEYYPHEIAGRTDTTLTLAPHSSDDADDFAFGRERFMEEGRTLARFDHPNIVRVRSYFEAHGTGYLVMDYYEGRTLAEYLAAQGGTLPEAEALCIVRDVLRGLQSVHEEGLLHRDIDPQNVYRTEAGRIVLLDFGAARAAMEARSTGDRVIFKPGYAPPEQYFSGGEQGAWTDVYACAATLYKCLTGMKPPAAGRRLQEDDLVPPRDLNADVSLEVSVAVRRGLSLEPEDRPASVEAFARLLDDAASEGTTTERARPGSDPQWGGDASLAQLLPWQGTGRVRWLHLLLGGVVAVLALGAAWFFVQEASSSKAAAPPRSIAVLPFETVGAEEGTQFAQGIHDDLLSRLSGVSDLRVISRTSVMQYQETSRTLPEIARELGVRWIVEGTVQRVGSQVQVNAQLIHAQNDTHEWGQNYQRALTTENLFAIQDELTTKIARSLEATLTTQEEERIARRPTENLEAYRLYVKGRALLDRRSDEGIQQAARYFQQALARDSSYALAWAGLADARSLLSLYGYAPADSVLPTALAAADRAVELNPDLAEAHASRALVNDYRRNGPAAIRGYQKALDLNPNYARAHQWLGNLYLALGRRAAAVSHLQTAAELDPMSPSIHAALAGAHNRRQPPRTEAALTHTDRAKQLAPDYAAGHIVEGVALSRAGRYEEALLALQRGLDMAAPGDGVRRLHLGKPAVVRVQMGDTTGARAQLQRLEANDESPFARAEVHAALGEADAAFADLRRVEWAKFLAAELRYGPALAPLRGDPRYRSLLQTVNQIWGLNADGTLPVPEESATGIASER